MEAKEIRKDIYDVDSWIDEGIGEQAVRQLYKLKTLLLQGS